MPNNNNSVDHIQWVNHLLSCSDYDSYTTSSPCIEQEEALDTDYRDDLF